ncbi:MAG TPA: hypothetical protein VFQ72_03285 [Candidatus Paceibacterota bacterium]|nr:hypothetical protein [Candidatus Paceibacterota bacterium]
MTLIMDRVMAKVRTIFLLRRLAVPAIFLVVACAVVGSTVSVSNVIANMPSLVDIPAIAGFYARAFAHADVVVKSALVAGTLFLLLTLKGVVDSVRLSTALQKA